MRPLAEQIIDALLAEDSGRYAVYDSIRTQRPWESPKTPPEDEIYRHIGMFMSRWMELEAFVRDAAPPQRGSGPVIATTRQLRGMNLLTEATEYDYDQLRRMRNLLVHGVELPTAADLDEATKRLDIILTDISSNDCKTREIPTEDLTKGAEYVTQPEDLRPITDGIYRERRAYLADHVFLNVPSAGMPPSDLLGEREWSRLTDLSTDVLLRTTDHLGSMIDDMLTQGYAWLSALPLDDNPDSAPYVFHAHLEAHDEFEAAPFIAAHGWYRQATSALRNALEVMTHAVRFAVRNDNAGFRSWRNASADPPKFGNSVDLIRRSPAVAEIDASLGGSGIFGNNPVGVLRTLYADVCRYAHSRSGHTNADIWRSNGPVFIGRAFTQFWLDFCDILLMCYVLLKIGYPELRLPEALEGIAGNAGQGWQGMAPAAIAAYFQTSG